MPALALILSTATAARVGAFDPDAEIAIAAVEAAGGTLTGAQKDAANAFVVTIKAASIWPKLSLLYLFMGGTAASHAINWITPESNDVTWNNSPTHSALGVQFASTAYGDTGFTPTNPDGMGLFAYVNSLNTIDTEFGLLGAVTNSFSLDAFLTIGGDNLVACQFGDQFARTGEAGLSRATGFIFGGRTSDTNLVQRAGATQADYTTGSCGASSPELNLFIGAYNEDGAATGTGNGRLAMAGVSASALDAAELVILDTAATTLQTSLSRA